MERNPVELATRDDRPTGRGKTAEARKALRHLDRLFANSPGGDSTTLIRAMRDEAATRSQAGD
jgi:hypothetical protein